MMFKNSFRLFCVNFDKVWKLLVYQIFVLGLTCLLLLPFYQTISSTCLTMWDKYDEVLGKYFLSGTFYGVNMIELFFDTANAILFFVVTLFSSNLFCGIYTMVVLFIIEPIFANIGKYTICEMVYGYMSSSSKISFTGTLLRTLKRSIPYSLLKTLYSLPFDALILVALYGLTRVQVSGFEYALPFLIVLVPAFLLAVRQIFISGWAPATIVFDQNPVKAYGQGMVAVLRRGFRVFSTAFVIYLLAMILAMVIGLYSLIIILPCIFPLVDIFDMVVFFSSQGMRFYVDADTILSPKKLEENDRIEKAKFLL